VPGGVFAGARGFRITPSAGSALAAVYSVNLIAYASLVLQTGQSNYLSFVLRGIDQKLDTLLPLPPEADGTTLQFYDPAAQSFGPPITFVGGIGWLDAADESPVVNLATQSACVVMPRSSVPGATNVVSTTVGEVPQGLLQRTLPPGYSLNGP